MKKRVLIPFAAIGLLAAMSACGGKSVESAPKDGNTSEISEFTVKQVIKSAEQNYRVEMDGDTAYLDLYTTVQWPEEFGKADLKTLQDSLVTFCYGDTTGMAINDAMHAFLNDTSMFADMPGGKHITAVDSIPNADGVRTYFTAVNAQVTELTQDYATYQVTTSSYLGGAHPYTATRPFTYDLQSAKVLALDDILTPAGVDSIMPVIRTALSRQLEVPENMLERAGIFTSQLTKPGYPYISGNVLYFHYNPYEIAPYSAGMIDIPVYPYEIASFIKPEAKALFDTEY